MDPDEIRRKLHALNELLEKQMVHSDMVEALHIPFRELMVTLYRGRGDSLLILIEGDSWDKLNWLDRKAATLLRDPDQRVMKTCSTSRMRADDSRVGFFGYFPMLDSQWGNCIIQIYDR